jgi:HPt (histidine-containing phosphotransfer) domain-containing protein
VAGAQGRERKRLFDVEEESNPIVDWTLFQRSRTELGPGFVRILGYFREDGEKSVAKIEDAMQRKDAAALVIPAHTLKSEARQFGAEPLGELAEEIEFAARRAVEQRLFPDELIPQVAKLRPLYRETMDLFEKEINPRLERKPANGGDVANQSFGRL